MTVAPGSFTAHNIRLDDGSETLPGSRLVADNLMCLTARRVLQMLYPGGLRPVRIADLGCLEGGFTVEFARMGVDALGVEVRQSNFRNCLYVRQHVDLPNLKFDNDDAWNLEKYGTIDVIFCCGLLYHMERPVAFIKMLSGLCRKALILDTHFASTKTSHRDYKLSDMTEHEGVKGRWFREYNPAEVARSNNLDDMKWSSWTNDQSFWIQREYIFDALKDAGFSLIFEHFDSLAGPISRRLLEGYYATDDRGTFIGIKV